MKIKTKVNAITISSIGLVFMVGVILLWSAKQVRVAIRTNETAGQIVKGVFDLNILTHDYLLHQEKRTQNQWQMKHASLSQLISNEKHLDAKEQHFLQEIKQYYKSSKDTFLKLVNSYENNAGAQQQLEASNKLTKRWVSRLLLESQAMVTSASQLAQESQAQVIMFQKRNSWIVACLVVMIVILIILNFWVVGKSIVVPIAKLKEGVTTIGSGNLDYQIDIITKDEIGELAENFNVMAAGLKESREQLVSADELKKKSKELEEINLKLETQTKLKTSITVLNDAMRGDQDVAQLGNSILNFLIPYLSAQIGSLHVIDEGHTLRLVSTYAHANRKNLANAFKMGEGLVGQAALEKKHITINNVPEDYIKINSGLGEAVPRNILVFPIFFEEEVKGVVEIGSFKELSNLQINFLNQVNKDIGITLNGALSRVKMKELLEETQQQSEELQTQQEELRASNEELEEQAKNLKESESSLQLQQEELRATNEELEEQRRTLEHKNRDIEKSRKFIEETAKELKLANQYKSEFLANMSHELRTPLNSTLILSKLLSKNEENNLTEKQIEYAQIIHQSGTDLLELINEILDLSKVEAGKLKIIIEDVELVNLAAFVQRNFEHMAEDKGLYLKVEITEGAPKSIQTDSQRLEQIIKNFISNALKFTSEGGVTVNIGRPSSETSLSKRELELQKTIAISVEDTGTGIPQDKQDVIFQAFQQAEGGTNRKYGGTGLGLTISKELVKLLGGEIQLSSKDGQGSRFTVYLPETLQTDCTKKVEEKSQKVFNSSWEKDKFDHDVKIIPATQITDPASIRDDRRDISENDKSILFIEDDPCFAKILYDLAHERGFKGLIASDGKSGLHFADHYKPSAIVLDIKLPDMDGRIILWHLKDNPKTRHIPVHVMSGLDVSDDVLKMGAIGFLTKPINSNKLTEAFAELEKMFSKKVKRLLVVEDSVIEQKSISALIGDGGVETITVGQGQRALELLKSEKFDCMILDLTLSDMSGIELLEKLKDDKTMLSCPPVIIYTGKDLSKDEEIQIRKYSESIIIKSAKSPERLLDETTLFLHRMEADLPQEKQEMLRVIHNKEMVFDNKSILVVDDDMRNIFALTSVLEGKGMRVRIGKNGKEALSQLSEDASIDLVLMDLMMPEMDGYEAMTEIRKQTQFKKLPIIALTAKAMKGDKEKCIKAGASDYLSKPVDIDKLFSLMRVWLYQ